MRLRNGRLERDRLRRVAVLRLDKVGDLLLSTPAIRNVRSALPEAHINLITAPYNSQVLQGWDAIDELSIYDPAWPAPRKRRFTSDLRLRGVDACLVLSPIMDAYRLGYALRAPLRAGIVYSTRVVPRLLAPLLLTHTLMLDIEGQLSRREPVTHEVRQMLALCGLVGLPSEPYPLEVPLSSADSDWAVGLLGELSLRRPLLAFHLSPKWLTGGWTPGQLCGLVAEAITQGGFGGAVVTYGPAEAQVIEALRPLIAQTWPREPRPVALVGDLSFGRWTGLFAQADLVITTDTGALHLAAALRRKVVALYEHATFAHCSAQWAPWQAPNRVVEKLEFPETSTAILSAVSDLMAL